MKHCSTCGCGLAPEPAAMRALWNKAVIVQTDNRATVTFETAEEAETAFDYLKEIGSIERPAPEPPAELAKWLRQEASFWRNDAFENAAKICERYESHDAARDIRHLKGSSQPPRDGQ